MKLICPGLRREVHDATVETAEFGGSVVGFNFEFLNRIDDRHECHLAGFRLQNTDRIEEILIRPRPPTINPGKL